MIRPPRGIVKTRDQAGQRALARAGRADDADAFARLRLEAHVLQHRIGFVGEPDIFKGNAAPHFAQSRRGGRGRDGDGRIHHFEDAARAGQALLHGIRNLPDV